MKFLVSIIFLLFFSISFCQDEKDPKVEEIFSELKSKYSSDTDYAFSMSYRLYKGHNTGNLSEHYVAQLFHTENGSYQKIKNTVFINTKSFSVKVNHDEKAMAISHGNNKDFFQEYKNALSVASSYSYTLTDDNNYEINLFFYGHSDLPYYKMSILVDKSKLELKEVNLFYSAKIDFDPSFNRRDMAKPHLRIKYQKTDTSQFSTYLFLKKKYYQIKSGQLIVNNKYADYQVINNLQ